MRPDRIGPGAKNGPGGSSAGRRPALTGRGWALVGAGVAMFIGARVLGVVELAMLGVAALAAVVAALVSVRRGAVHVSARRGLRPVRAEAGAPARADLTLRNLGARATRMASATDSFDGGRRVARFLVPSLAPGEAAEAAYNLPTGRRGIYSVGPLELSVTDPFGVAEATVTAAGVDRFLVYPKVEAVLPLPGTSKSEARVGSFAASRVPAGLDFFGLRAYEMGDDLRRVHWRSTARTGELMLRQDEMPWESRATVLLDTRAAAHRGESFERAVEVTASLVSAMCQGRRHLRLLTTGGVEIRSAGRKAYPAIMEYLAGVAPEATGHFDVVVDGLRKAQAVGPLAAVVATATPLELSALGALGSRTGLVVLALIRPSSTAGSEGGPVAPVPGALVVPVEVGLPFREAWNQAVSACRGRAAARS